MSVKRHSSTCRHVHHGSRRAFLLDAGMGFTSLAIGALLARDGILRGGEQIFAPPTGQPHFPPKAKSVIWIFLCGGLSHMESFDPKPALNEHAGKISVLYSRLHIGSSQRFPEARRLAPADIEALDMLAELAGDPELRLDMNFMPGDIQFLHNHTILHDRTAFEDWQEPEHKRHLLRLWLAAPGARPLPTVYTERYGSIAVGDRGGIICMGTKLHAPLDPV